MAKGKLNCQQFLGGEGGVGMTEQLRIVSRQFVSKNLSFSSSVCWGKKVLGYCHTSFH